MRLISPAGRPCTLRSKPAANRPMLDLNSTGSAW